MGRKRKFGEESDFVSVRVPKSKRQEYRKAIKNFVEKKFAIDNKNGEKDSMNKDNRKKLEKFRRFEEFARDIKQLEKNKDNILKEKKESN